MPYRVQNVSVVYTESDDDRAHDDLIEDYLNHSEEHGWSLVGIIGDHPVWDDDGEPDGRVSAMLILHKPGRGTPTKLDDIRAKVAATTGATP